MYLIRRILYYLGSLPTLLFGVRNWPVLLRLSRQAQGSEPAVLVLRDGSKYYLRTLLDAWIIKESNLDRNYERYGAKIEDRWNVVDLGAALGDFTVFAARRTPHGHVFAYEPAPDSVSLLERNLALNRTSNVKVFPYAVSSSAGTLLLDVSGNEAVQYRTAGGASDDDSRIAVQSVTLAEVLAMIPTGVCDFLKMDCEGAEYDILLNLDEVVMRKINRICLEYHLLVTQYSASDLVDFFAKRGWRAHLYPSKVRRDLGFLYAERR